VYGLDLISATDSQDAQTYFTYDGLGSVTDLTDDDGDVIDGYTYAAFGAIHSQSGSSDNYWLFTGEQSDSDEGLYYLRARYYDPATGRFLGRDPVPGTPTKPSTQHPYAYALNNPCRFTDRSGLASEGAATLTYCEAHFTTEGVGDETVGWQCLLVIGPFGGCKQHHFDTVAELHVSVLHYQNARGAVSLVWAKADSLNELIWDVSSGPLVPRTQDERSVDVHASFNNRNRKIAGIIPIVNSNGATYDVNFSFDQSGRGSITHHERDFGRLSRLLTTSFQGFCLP
jgi:RHS repeat-associated protein